MKQAFLKQEAEVFAVSKEWRRMGPYFIKPDRLTPKTNRTPPFHILNFKYEEARYEQKNRKYRFYMRALRKNCIATYKWQL